jgi:hypothetical protein
VKNGVEIGLNEIALIMILALITIAISGKDNKK